MTQPTRRPALQLLLAALCTQSCLYSLDNPNDPKRCDPACGTSQACVNRHCVARGDAQRDGVSPDRPSVDLRDQRSDSAAADARREGKVADAERPDTKPTGDTKATVDTKPAADTKQKPDTKAVMDTKPAPDTTPAPDQFVPIITITGPGAAASWMMATSQTIAWADNIAENVKIELLKGAAAVPGLSCPSTPSTGSYNWKIPTSLVPGADYQIRITSVLSSAISAVSAPFSIIAYSGKVADIDGNQYDAIQVGPQVWMKQNLRASHYADGSPITGTCPNEPDVVVYGRHYSWSAATNGGGTQGACPTGWHLPSELEFTQLAGHVSQDCGELKETGTAHWKAPNAGATNSTGFTAVGSGYGIADCVGGNFGTKDETAYYWSSSSIDAVTGSAFVIMSTIATCYTNQSQPKAHYFALRCIMTLP